MVIDDATLVSRGPSALTTPLGAELVMLNLDTGRYFSLDAVAADVWRGLEAPCTFAALVDRLSSGYDAERAAIAADVGALLDNMAAAGVVTLAFDCDG